MHDEQKCGSCGEQMVLTREGIYLHLLSHIVRYNRFYHEDNDEG